MIVYLKSVRDATPFVYTHCIKLHARVNLTSYSLALELFQSVTAHPLVAREQRE